MIKTRQNELTAVFNRSKFDECPGDITNEYDKQRWKEFRVRYHAAQNLELSSTFPLQIDFELSYSCNFGCSFCPHGNPESLPQPKKNTKLTFEDFKKVIDEGKQHGLCSIKMNYINEPLLVPWLCDAIKYAKGNGVLNVYFATNGTLLTETMSRRLIESGVTKIMVSIDASTPETFLKMRQSNKFFLICSNIRKFLQVRELLGLTWPLVRVNFVKTNINIHEAEDFTSQWKDIVDMIGFEEQVALPGVEDENLLNKKPEDFGCSFPFKMLVLDSEKNILPCCTFSGRKLPLGNLDSMSMSEAWSSFKMQALRKIHQDKTLEKEPICLHCIGRK